MAVKEGWSIISGQFFTRDSSVVGFFFLSSIHINTPLLITQIWLCGQSKKKKLYNLILKTDSCKQTCLLLWQQRMSSHLLMAHDVVVEFWLVVHLHLGQKSLSECFWLALAPQPDNSYKTVAPAVQILWQGRAYCWSIIYNGMLLTQATLSVFSPDFSCIPAVCKG